MTIKIQQTGPTLCCVDDSRIIHVPLDSFLRENKCFTFTHTHQSVRSRYRFFCLTSDQRAHVEHDMDRSCSEHFLVTEVQEIFRPNGQLTHRKLRNWPALTDFAWYWYYRLLFLMVTRPSPDRRGFVHPKSTRRMMEGSS